MPGPKKLDPSSTPHALLGAELRHRRDKSGLCQEELGLPLFSSGSFIGQLESGTRRMGVEVADGHPGVAPVRESKVPDGPALVFRTATWSTFVADLKHAKGNWGVKERGWGACIARRRIEPDGVSRARAEPRAWGRSHGDGRQRREVRAPAP
ncbi:DUF397 domain-containing protein [Streptomyces sp. NPDC005969]|uniref:DUF397 domain-containing protein n=1 Tax=Streptomyces sp. NPDC005969 TaxID=3156722 RepID=UPI0033EBBF84